MDGWFQDSDYTSVDLRWEQEEDMLSVWRGYVRDAAQLDAAWQRLEQQGADCCPWNVGLTGVDATRVQIYRDDPALDTFAAFITWRRPVRRFFGLFNGMQEEQRTVASLTAAAAERYLRAVWNNDVATLAHG